MTKANLLEDKTELESSVVSSVSLDVPWDIVDKFSKIVRLSGSKEERDAVELIQSHLNDWGIPNVLHEPESFISIPLSASVKLLGNDQVTFRAKTPSMSISTGDTPVEGELVYISSINGDNSGDVFSTGVGFGDKDVSGKIVLTEGFASPGKLKDVMDAGAIAGIFINPGEAIHEGICTPIWGTPDLDNEHQQPTIPVVAVNHADGQELIAAANAGKKTAVTTHLDTAWRKIPVLEATIEGAKVPEEFVLLHGHLDSWHEGVGDNATGDATMLELARVFWENRESLDRTLKIAWWSGHSHGRYAGSTWYADQFGIELAENCVAQVNCDSPGCRWADTYNDLTAMSETVPFVNKVIEETTSITPQTERPPRAGDYSFNGVGLTGFYMLSSTMSEQTRAEKNYYAVGGCGGNIEWHTEGDTLEIADADFLLRDMKMYAASLVRVLNSPLAPFDFRSTVAEFEVAMDEYEKSAGEDFDFGLTTKALVDLKKSLETMYTNLPNASSSDDGAAKRFNFAQRRLARTLVPINYSRTEAFRHDPALNLPALPDYEAALTLPEVRGDISRVGVIRAHLTRGQNRVVWALIQAREIAESVTA